MTTIRTYSNMRRFETFEDRFDYLKLGGGVGRETFGFDRWINQTFYRSRQWQLVRDHVVARDLGRDLGVEGHDIHEKLLVHHMNPMSVEDIVHADESILDPEFLITTTHLTHNAIHYGTEPPARYVLHERSRGDTRLW